MAERWRALMRHALLGGVLAAVGLVLVTYEDGEGAAQPRLFAAQDARGPSEGPEARSSSRLARVAAALPRRVTVVVDGSERQLATEASTVAGALADAGAEPDADDRVRPPPGAPVQAGMTVEVARVEVAERTRTEPVDFDTVERPSEELADGVRQVRAAGEEGLVEIIEEVVLVDGDVESRTRVGARVRREPDDRVVLVGTSEAAGSSSESEGTSLARRQSAGSSGSSGSSSGGSSSPSAAEEAAEPSPSGAAQAAPEEPAPQEATGNVQEGKASRYADRFDGQSTASGEPYDPDALTAAHRELPLGTVVTVTNTSTGQSVRVRINDRGPHVAGRVIDLSRAAWNRVASPSAGLVHVRVEW